MSSTKKSRPALRLSRAFAGLLAVAGLVVVVSAARLYRFQPHVSDAPPDPRLVRGAIHVHSDRSDGTRDIGAIAAAARDAGLDFVVVTDHRDDRALGKDAYHEGVLVIRGVETSTSRGHVLAFGVEPSQARFDVSPVNVFADIDARGGLSVVAHPRSRRSEERWRFEGDVLFDAIEILSGSQDLVDLSWRGASGALISLVNPRAGFLRALRPNRESLELWDHALQGAAGPVVGLAGADAHRQYENLFALFSNAVGLDAPLSGDAEDDARRILRAIREGHVYVVLDAIGDARGFSYALMGERVSVPASLRVELPTSSAGSRIQLLRNGAVVAERTGDDLEYEATSAGIYRVEVYRNAPSLPSIPWIVSNPVYVGLPVESKSYPPAPAPPSAGVPLTLSDIASEADERSTVSEVRLDGAGTVAFDFEIGVVERAEGRSYCALIGVPVELAGASGVSFAYRASGVFRFDVQLRDENPNVVDGVEPFRASLRTSTEWQEVYVPFDGLESYDPDGDGRFDPHRARAMAIHLDTTTVRPGTSGSMWIRNLRRH